MKIFALFLIALLSLLHGVSSTNAVRRRRNLKSGKVGHHHSVKSGTPQSTTAAGNVSPSVSDSQKSTKSPSESASQKSNKSSNKSRGSHHTMVADAPAIPGVESSRTVVLGVYQDDDQDGGYQYYKYPYDDDDQEQKASKKNKGKGTKFIPNSYGQLCDDDYYGRPGSGTPSYAELNDMFLQDAIPEGLSTRCSIDFDIMEVSAYGDNGQDMIYRDLADGHFHATPMLLSEVSILDDMDYSGFLDESSPVLARYFGLISKLDSDGYPLVTMENLSNLDDDKLLIEPTANRFAGRDFMDSCTGKTFQIDDPPSYRNGYSYSNSDSEVYEDRIVGIRRGLQQILGVDNDNDNGGGGGDDDDDDGPTAFWVDVTIYDKFCQECNDECSTVDSCNNLCDQLGEGYAFIQTGIMEEIPYVLSKKTGQLQPDTLNTCIEELVTLDDYIGECNARIGQADYADLVDNPLTANCLGMEDSTDGPNPFIPTNDLDEGLTCNSGYCPCPTSTTSS